jgi:TonB family protein
MTRLPVERPRWPRRRWWLFVALVFSGQVGLIFWLSDTAAVQPRQTASRPTLRLAENEPADLLTLSDPTLFALPHRQGFSGLAWLQIPSQDFRAFQWSEDPRWLQLVVRRLGASLDRASESDAPNSVPRLARPAPRLAVGETLPPPAAPGPSMLRLEGDLAARRLIAPIDLPSWSSSDLLTNSVVQVIVDTEGRVASVPILLPPGSGDKEADDYALRQAKDARFEPVTPTGPSRRRDPMPRLTWGLMVFEWHTLPKPLTKSPPAGP